MNAAMETADEASWYMGQSKRMMEICIDMMGVALGLTRKDIHDMEYDDTLKKTYFTVDRLVEIAMLYKVGNRKKSIESAEGISQRTMVSIINNVMNSIGYTLVGKQKCISVNGVQTHVYSYSMSCTVPLSDIILERKIGPLVDGVSPLEDEDGLPMVREEEDMVLA